MHPDDIAAAKEVVAHAFAADAADAFHGIFADLARKNRGNKFVQFKTNPNAAQAQAALYAARSIA